MAATKSRPALMSAKYAGTTVAELTILAIAPGERDAVRAQRQAEFEPAAVP
jgi:hypothetical protein